MSARTVGRSLAVALLLCLGGAGPMAPAAHAQVSADIDDLRYRLRRLERDFNALRGPDSDTPSPLAARLQSRLDQMERTIQALTEKVEDLNHKFATLEKQRKAFEADTGYRLGLLEQRAGARPGPKPGQGPQQPAPRAGEDSKGQDGSGAAARAGDNRQAAAASILPAGPEIEQYKYAIGELRQARYGKAAAAFREFLQRHPEGRYAGNAWYWLGETYYAQENYREAAIRFADGFRKFPGHAKAPDILLKLGMSLAQLKETGEACASWAELARRFPSAPGYVKRKAARERKKFGCKS